MAAAECDLTEEQWGELKAKFGSIGEGGNVGWDDIKPALETVGVPLAGHEIRQLLGAQKPSITLDEFKTLYVKGKEIKDTSQAIKKSLLLKPGKDVMEFKKSEDSDVRHSVSQAEERGFIGWINKNLAGDKDLTPDYLPIDPDVEGQLYDRCTNGILLCKMINCTHPNTIDERTINKGASLKHVFNVNENLTLVVNSAAAIGCCVVNIGPEDIAQKNRHIVLGLIWQVIRKGLVDTITLSRHTELLSLLREGETTDELMKLKPEDLLMRWVNHHMERAGVDRRMRNFNTDIADSTIYSHLIEQIAPADKKNQLKSANSILSSSDSKERATDVLKNAEVLGAHGFLSPEDIYKADGKDKGARDRLNLGFLATLFNMYPGLEKQAEVQIEEETLEERTYKNWMNSLGVKPFVSILEVELSDGIVLLQLIDIIQPKTVDWSLVTLKFDPKKKLFQQQENCNMVITCAKKINIKFVNVSGEDIREKNKKLILGVCFQLMHAYTLKLLYEASGGESKNQSEKDILNWANEQLARANEKPIASFRDPAFATGIPVLQILEQIRPGSTDKQVWMESKGDNLSVCSYAISCCRKAGARIYALPEHLRDVNGKMIQTILVCLQAVHYSMKRISQAVEES